MNVVKYDEYTKQKMDFIQKHDSDFTIHTSEMDCYNSYHKEYVFEDGAVWYEVISLAQEEAKLEGTSKITGMKVFGSKLVRYNRIEFWNSDNSLSRYTYETI